MADTEDAEIMAIAHRAMRGWFRCHWKDEETNAWRKEFSGLIRGSRAANAPYFLALVILLVNKTTVEDVLKMIPRDLRNSLVRAGVTEKDLHYLNALSLIEFLDDSTDFKETHTMSIDKQNKIAFLFISEWTVLFIAASQQATPPPKFLTACQKGGVTENDALRLFQGIVEKYV
jgi:hypothetical protein